MDGQKQYITRLFKNGSGLAVIIPRDFLVAYNLQRGDYLVYECVNEKTFLLRKMSPEQLLLPTTIQI